MSCSAPGQPNLVLTPDEKRVFGQLFQAADCENLGVVTGELAVKFFEKSGLNPRILGEVRIPGMNVNGCMTDPRGYFRFGELQTRRTADFSPRLDSVLR